MRSALVEPRCRRSGYLRQRPLRRLDGDRDAIVDRARAGEYGDLIPSIAPRRGDIFLVKPGYSAFDDTPLRLLPADLAIERLVLAGRHSRCASLRPRSRRERG